MGVQVKELYYANGSGASEGLTSVLQRQFISFNFDGRDIEEFDLIATISGDSINKNLYADFDSITEDYQEVDGQLYFGDTYKENTFEFNLATDGMTEQQMSDFVHHFAAGKIGYLILTEHSNRRIKVRVESAPSMSMLPFEKTVDVVIGDTTYSTFTTEYKGEIELRLVADFPFWESIESFYDDSTFSSDSDYAQKEKLKTIYEDGIPSTSMFDTSKMIFLAGNYLYNGSEVIETAGVSIEKNDTKYYLYNCGTAASFPIIKFSINISYSTISGYDYISIPNNSKTSDIYNKGFSYIKIGDNDLYYTLPSIFASYNKALKIFSEYSSGDSYIDLEKEIKENVVDYYMRSQIINVIESIKGEDSALGATSLSNIASKIKSVMPTSFTVTIDCFNGKATISSMRFNDANSTTIPEENCGNMITSRYLKIEGRKLPLNGKITEDQCLKVESSENLSNLTIEYNYMYL